MSVALVKDNSEATGELPVVRDEVVIAESSYWSRDAHAECNPVGWALAQEWAGGLYKKLENAR